MSENNNIMSLEGQLVGMPLAGPESFSQAQLDYLKRALGVDETVLWENASGKSPNTSGAFPITLSEPISNFETVKFFWQTFNFAGNNNTVSEKMTNIADISLGDFIFNVSTSKAYSILWELSVSGTTLSHVAAYYKGFDSNTTTGDAVAFVKLYKIVGIHRIAGGN